MKKSVKDTSKKYGKSQSVPKSVKLVHLTFKVRGLLLDIYVYLYVHNFGESRIGAEWQTLLRKMPLKADNI